MKVLSRAAVHVRQRAGAAVVDSFFRGISSLGRRHPLAHPRRHGVEVDRDVPYQAGGAEAHLADVYRPTDVPRGGPHAPVVLYVHGGGFRILSKDTHWVMALAFARRGYVVINVSYRLAPEHPFPAAVDDVAAAYAWTVANAERFGGDPSRLILAGESAGANLVTSLALMASYRRDEPAARRVWETGVTPRAVVPACGIFEVERIERYRQRWPRMSGFIEDRLEEVSTAYLRRAQHLSQRERELANVLHVFERGEQPDRPLPPFLVPCGTKDPLIDDSQRLTRALRALGVTAESPVYPGELHAFHALVWRRNARRLWGHTYEFLERHVGPTPRSKGHPSRVASSPGGAPVTAAP